MKTIHIVAAVSPVRSVVVLKSSKAEVVRTFDVALKSGQNKLIISKLPSTIDTQSVRISGLNPDSSSKNKTYLSDVVCSVSETSDDALNAAVRALEAKKSALEKEKEVLDAKGGILFKYANSLTGEYASPDVMDGFLNAFVEHGKRNVQSIATLQAQIEEIDERIKEEKKKSSLLKGSVNTELTVVITADNDTHLNLKLTYIVNNTNWSPTYELHAVTGDNGQPSRTVSLHYRACITQSTGEDWTDAALTLSTVATDTIIKRIPKLEPVKIRVSSNYSVATRGGGVAPIQQQSQNPFQELNQTNLRRAYYASPAGHNVPIPPPPPPPAAAIPRSLPLMAAASGVERRGRPAPPRPPRSAPDSGEIGIIALPDEEFDAVLEGEGIDDDETPAKLVTQTPMALTYAVRGRSSIPSDGKEHIVTIAVLSFETDVEYVSVPRVDPRVYLQCQVKNNSEYRLLPGPVSIILDDSYVSKTTISDVNRNDTFSFTLGDDPSVLISYSRLSKSTKEGSGTFADVVNITTYTTTLVVQNKHGFPIEKLILRDAVPMSDDRRVRVVLRKPKELVEAKEGVLVKVKPEHGKTSDGNESSEKETGSGKEDEGCLKVKWEKEKDGLYEYRWRVDADAKVKLETVFEMKASADLTCSFMDNWAGLVKKGQCNNAS